ncbi:MAG TPA: hypothetical protein VIN58_05580 [Roseateles sp.]
MSINGMRFPSSIATFQPASTAGDAGTAKSPSPAPGAGDALRSDLPAGPPRGREGAIPPRAALAMLASVQAAAGGMPATPEAIAVKVRQQVGAGKVLLSAPHSEGALRAALLAAARGLTALGKESGRPEAK